MAGDYALVRSKLPVEEDDDHLPECDICFVPGIVQVTPLRQKSANKCYTVMRFNGTKVTYYFYFAGFVYYVILKLIDDNLL